MFKYDPRKLPYVRFTESWGNNESYEVGDWSFDLLDENDIDRAERSIYTWIAWYEFLKRRAENGTETKG
jgi:hypothetical protein